MSLTFLHILIISATVFAVIGSGFYVSRSVRSSAGYSVAGRSAGLSLSPEASRERSSGRRYGRYGAAGLLFWPFRVVVYPGKRYRFYPYGYFLCQTASQYSTGNNSSISGTLLRKEGRDAFFHYFFHRYPSVRCCQFTAGHRDHFRPFRADAFSVRPSPYGSRYRLYFFGGMKAPPSAVS